MSQTRPKQIAQEGATPGQSLVWDGLEWAPTNDRLTETGQPVFGGGPGALTYTLGRDEIITFRDVGFPTEPPATLTITLPPIASCLPGERVGFRLFSGNPISDVIFVPGISDAIIDPTTLAFSGPPGSGFTLPQNSVPGYSTFVWEAVVTSLGPVWFFVYDAAGGGGGGGDYESTLALGQDSGVLGPYLNRSSRQVVGSNVGTDPNPGAPTAANATYRYEGSHTRTLVGGGGEAAGTYVLDPVDIFQNLNLSTFDGVVIVEWEAFRFASNNGFNPPTLRGFTTAKEVWNIGNGSTAMIGAQTGKHGIQFSGFDVARIAIGSTPRSIAFEVLESPVAGPPMVANFTYRVTIQNNTTAF